MSENNLKEIWDIALDNLEQEYKNAGKEIEFKLWFNMKYIEDSNLTIKVSVPSAFMWNQMLSKGNVGKVKEKIKQITGQDCEIESVIVEQQIFEPEKESKDSKNEEKPTEPSKTGIETQNSTESQTSSQLNFFSKLSKKTENTEKPSRPKNSFLDENMTFENFISEEGSSSNFAYKVAMDVANNPGFKRNPILLYGGCGLGKTHLMQAIGNKIYEQYGEKKKICYIQSESFLNEFVNSMSNRKADAFKIKYRKLDVLLLDDIHFLQGKPGIQDELFYTFEELKKNKAQMVFTCDRPLKEINNMTERLVSRLGSGMCLNLDMPNYETRKAIIYKKLKDVPPYNVGVEISEEVIDYIARIIETNIRDLEAALEKVTGYAEFFDGILTLDMVQQQLQDFYSGPKIGNITIGNIMKTVAENFDITVEEMKGKKRDKKYTNARHIAIYIAHELTDYTFMDLGNEFGGRDHSSIMHANNKIMEMIKTDQNFKQMIEMLIKEIKEKK